MKFTASILFVVAYLAVVYASVDLNQIFTVTVVGSFRQDIPGFPCDSCDCTVSDNGFNGSPPCSSWYDGVVCDSTYGPEDDQQRWGHPAGGSNYICFGQSGVGFQGVTDITMQANAENATRIGGMTHYNNVINPPSPTKLQLYINMSSPQLTDNFETVFPLSFYETPNVASASACDPSIQRTNVPCDDRFSFDAFTPTLSFLSNNVRYTLQITGFLQPGNPKPLAQFVTKEGAATRADVFAKIVTFCEAVDCDLNYQFEGAPTCACVCILTNKTCNSVFGPTIAVNETDCACECALDSEQLGCNASNPDIGAFNHDTCSCGCNITNVYCKSLNSLWEASLIPGTCGCACNRQRFIDCRTQNVFFLPTGDTCACTCAVTDDACKELFGKHYKANKSKCSCFVPGSSTGLTNAEIAGIVVATVVGPILLILAVLILAGILAYLILAGYIPGIYGYKIAQGSFAAGGNSSLYADPWQNNSNAAAV